MYIQIKDNKLKVSVIISAILSFCFVVFTILVKFVDTAFVGITGKKIGFASLNKIFYDNIRVNELFDKLSDAIMILSIVLVVCVIVIAIVQLVKRKTFKKVDKEIYAFAIVLVFMVCIYVLFEIIELNFRPVLTDGKVEASYPSSHTMLVLTIFMCFAEYLLSKLKSKKNKIICTSIIGVLIIVAVLFRVLSGMHWITDIVASILLSLMLASYYALINCLLAKWENKNGK